MTATAPRLARRGRLVAAGLVGGLAMSASLPPLGWWPLGIVGVALLARAVRDASTWRGRLAAGAAAGLGVYGPGLWWVTEFHVLGWLVVVMMEAALLALAVAAVPPRRVAVGLPAALVVAEAVRGRWPFGGLPLAGLDLGQVGGPLLPVARLGGHLLLVAVVGVAGAGLTEAARGRVVVAAACLGVTVAAALAGSVAFDGVDRGALSVAAVQGGGPRGLRAVNADPAVPLDAQIAAMGRVPAGTSLVVWPEDVVDVDGPLSGSPEEAELSALARQLQTTLVVGVVEDLPGTLRFRNAAVVFGPDGRVGARYDKVHRVPFGEYVPLRGLIEHLADLSEVPRDAIAGRGPGVLATPPARVAVAISYEVFFADRARSGAAAGGQLLLVPTNASSYTTSQVPTQELAAARLRAVETGRWVVQAAPTGFSAIVDQRGRVRARSSLGPPAVLASTVRQRTGRTLAVRVGEIPVAFAGVLVLLALRMRKSER